MRIKKVKNGWKYQGILFADKASAQACLEAELSGAPDLTKDGDEDLQLEVIYDVTEEIDDKEGWIMSLEKLTEEQRKEAKECLKKEYTASELKKVLKGSRKALDMRLRDSLCRAGKLPCKTCGKPTTMYYVPKCFHCTRPILQNIELLNLIEALKYIELREPGFRDEFWEIVSDDNRFANDTIIPAYYDLTEPLWDTFAKYFPEVKGKTRIAFEVSW